MINTTNLSVEPRQLQTMVLGAVDTPAFRRVLHGRDVPDIADSANERGRHVTARASPGHH